MCGMAQLLWSGWAHAYRPFDSTDASVVDAGTLEIELGPIAYIDTPDGHATKAPEITINAGLTPHWELVMEGTRATTVSRMHDVQTVEAALLLKAILREGAMQDEQGWSVATEFGALLPVRNGDEDYGATLALIGSLRGEHAVLHVNAAAHNRNDDSQWMTGLILEACPDAPVRPVVEINVELENGSDARTLSALAGAIWRRAENLSFDVAVRASRDADAWSYEGRIGLTWSFAFTRT
jgi:hypothetical protein